MERGQKTFGDHNRKVLDGLKQSVNRNMSDNNSASEESEGNKENGRENIYLGE